MKTKVEFKVQVSENQPWEMTQITKVGEYESIQEILLVGTTLMQLTGKKVRWNYAGLTQGHYIEVDQEGAAQAAHLKEQASQNKEFQNSIGRYTPEPEPQKEEASQKKESRWLWLY